MIIVPEPVGENPASCLVGQVELGVGPLLQEWADAALCLAVGLGSVGASGVVPDPQRGAGAPRDVPSLSGSPPGWSGPDGKARRGRSCAQRGSPRLARGGAHVGNGGGGRF